MDSEAADVVTKELEQMVKEEWITLNNNIRTEAVAYRLLTVILQMPFHKVLRVMKGWLP